MVHNMKNMRNTIVMINRLKLKSLNPSNHVLLQSSQVVFLLIQLLSGQYNARQPSKKKKKIIPTGDTNNCQPPTEDLRKLPLKKKSSTKKNMEFVQEYIIRNSNFS